MNKKPKSSAKNFNICSVDAKHPDILKIVEAADIIKKGGGVILPTRTLYAIGVDAFNPEAVKRVFQIKQRQLTNPLSVLIKSMDALDDLAAEVPSAALKLMEHFWPGRLTIVFNARPDVPIDLTAGTLKIGIRIPEHPVAVKLLSLLNHPLTGTSANLSGCPGADCISDLPLEIIRRVDRVLDAGKLKGGTGSTVVDVTRSPPLIIREGEVLKGELFQVLRS